MRGEGNGKGKEGRGKGKREMREFGSLLERRPLESFWFEGSLDLHGSWLCSCFGRLEL